MNKKLTSLLKKVFLSSLAGIAASQPSNAENKIIEFDSNPDENNYESTFKKRIELSPKLLLKKISNTEWNFIAHRSHRSHSSHRSHYSSSSGSSSGSQPRSTTPQTYPSSPQNTPTIKPGANYYKSKSDSTSNSGTAPTVFKLGSRTLKKGMSGTDVTELINILLKKQYLKLEGNSTQVTGSYTYTDIIEGAVKKFQIDNGLTSDGICNSVTVYYLKNK